jgi:hypothetical protein
MARIRTIKPEFFTSEDVVGLSAFARLLYIALWCESDKEGRLVWKPKTFKMRYFPADSVEIEALCAELTDSGLVVRYGDGFAHIPTFTAHQHINPRESASQLPEPTRQARVGTRQPRDSDTQGGREGKGKEGDSASASPPGFDSFWDSWPKSDRKQARGKCLDAWKKAGAEPQAALVVAHVQRMSAGPWLKDGGQYIPAPLTYLNQKRWEGADDAANHDPYELGRAL